MGELTAIPSTLDAGTAYTIRRRLEDYPASEDWVLTLHLHPKTGEPQHVEAAADDDDHLLALASTITAALAAGHCRYQETVSRGEGEALEGPFAVSRGELLVQPDLINGVAGSALSADEKRLVLIQSVLYDRAVADIDGYQVDGTVLTPIQYETLSKEESRLRRRVYRRRHPGMFAGQVVFTTRAQDSGTD